MSKKAAETQEFIAPYVQPELNGELGLTSLDIAKVLDVQHKNVVEKLNRADHKQLQDSGFLLAVNTANNYRREGTFYYLSVDTAKFVIAKWNNPLGYSYLKYLFNLEAALPRIKKEYEDLQAKHDDLYAQMLAYKAECERKKLKGKRVTAIVCKLVQVATLFGIEYETVYEEKPWDALTESELREARLRHNAKVSKGLAESIERDLNEEHDKRVKAAKAQGNILIEAMKPNLKLLDIESAS